MPNECAKHAKLLQQAQEVLERIRKLTTKQVPCIVEGVNQRFLQMDRELELAMGEKERAVGALREHDKEHGCQTQHDAVMAG